MILGFHQHQAETDILQHETHGTIVTIVGIVDNTIAITIYEVRAIADEHIDLAGADCIGTQLTRCSIIKRRFKAIYLSKCEVSRNVNKVRYLE